MSAIDLMMNRYVECPHCGHKVRELWEYGLNVDEEITVECGDCGEPYRICCEVTVIYTAYIPTQPEPA